MEEVKRLLEFFKGSGEEVSLTVTGHSLGGALALLSAYDAASSLPDLDHISVIHLVRQGLGTSLSETR